jgi:holo-ACP synthase
MKVLERVLSGREGRARLQKYILESAPLIVQVSLNLPGYPKETAGSLNLVEAIGVFMVKKCTSMGGRTPSLWVLENGMGPAFLFGAEKVPPKKVKELAMSLEDRSLWGAVLDIDVILSAGALTRASLGYRPRKCFLCDLPAKECARQRRHEIGELRKIAESSLRVGLREMSLP